MGIVRSLILKGSFKLFIKNLIKKIRLALIILMNAKNQLHHLLSKIQFLIISYFFAVMNITFLSLTGFKNRIDIINGDARLYQHDCQVIE